MRNSYSFVLAVFITVSCASAKADAVLPANLDLPGFLVPGVTQLYAQSSTFRAQCARLAGAANVRVSVRLDMGIRQSCRAFTIIRRRRGMMLAEVHVPPANLQFAELIGHEFEHIVEQLECLDLRTLSKIPGSGVREVDSDLFETERAQHAGRVIAEETRLARSARPAAD